ncbi:MAG: DUF2452 domain-containing protein [Woeseiaceae bacterium]
MNTVTEYRRHGKDVAAKTEGNPEGKGLNGFLLDWHSTEPGGIVAKGRRQILAEFFTSMLVLSASFKYRPAVGRANHLYFVDGAWLLSLIAPEEWSARHRDGYAGSCVLQPDMTWTIEPAERLGECNQVADAIARFYDAFVDTLDSDLTLEEILPFYVRRMPYWQRLHASALSRSIRAALMLGDQTETRCRDWQVLLPEFDVNLLVHDSRP